MDKWPEIKVKVIALWRILNSRFFYVLTQNGLISNYPETGGSNNVILIRNLSKSTKAKESED